MMVRKDPVRLWNRSRPRERVAFTRLAAMSLRLVGHRCRIDGDQLGQTEVVSAVLHAFHTLRMRRIAGRR